MNKVVIRWEGLISMNKLISLIETTNQTKIPDLIKILFEN